MPGTSLSLTSARKTRNIAASARLRGTLHNQDQSIAAAHADVSSLERIERDAWESLCRAMPPELARDLGLEIRRFGDILMTLCARVDQGQFNRLFGFDIGDGTDSACIRDAADRFRAAGLCNPFIQIGPGHAALQNDAEAAGLIAYKRPWVKFRRDHVGPPSPPSALVIAAAAAKDSATFGAVIAGGFGMPPAMAAWMSALVGHPDWRCYIAYDSGVAIGGAAMYLRGAAGWLGAGATLPEARRRGAQSALLARRIADAANAGARVLTTETGKPLPGEQHPSYANILRAGFAVAYERANWTFPASG